MGTGLKKSVEQLEEEADKGSSRAMVELAGRCEELCSFDKAFRINQTAMKLGNNQAEFNYYNAYFNGWGVERDYDKAIEGFRNLYVSSLENNDAEMRRICCYYIALFAEKGYGNEHVDFQKAKEWYEEAIKYGDTWSLTNLANMYLEGRGVEKDSRKARELYEKAAERGDDTAKMAVKRIDRERRREKWRT